MYRKKYKKNSSIGVRTKEKQEIIKVQFLTQNSNQQEIVHCLCSASNKVVQLFCLLGAFVNTLKYQRKTSANPWYFRNDKAFGICITGYNGLVFDCGT